MSGSLDWVGTLSGPVGVALGAWGKGWWERRRSPVEEGRIDAEATKIDAEAAKVFTEIAVSLVAPLEARIAKLERENSAAFAYIRTLLAWISTHVPGKTPPAPPAALGL